MSLVVAHLRNGILSAVSDTGIIKSNHKLPSEQYIAKICVVSPSIAVGFAGDPGLGIKALNKFTLANASIAEIIKYFWEFHIEHYNIEFILLLNQASSKIVEIRNGKFIRFKASAWVGDENAFKRFQRHNLEPIGSIQSSLEMSQIFAEGGWAELPIATGKMVNCMRFVINDVTIKSVFGFCIAVSDARPSEKSNGKGSDNNITGGGAFRYRSYTYTVGPREIANAIPIKFDVLLPQQIEEINSFCMGCFVSRPESAQDGIAYHYPHGKITYMFYGPKGRPLNNPIVIRGKNIVEFMAYTAANLGIKWHGGIMSRNQLPSEYGVDFIRVNPRFFSY